VLTGRCGGSIKSQSDLHGKLKVFREAKPSASPMEPPLPSFANYHKKEKSHRISAVALNVLLLFDCVNANLFAILAHTLKLNLTVDKSEK
jgi:hypothetical protein